MAAAAAVSLPLLVEAAVEPPQDAVAADGGESAYVDALTTAHRELSRLSAGRGGIRGGGATRR